VRFYYKEKESINAKILKDVKFPLDFDAFELCSPELQQKLTPMRTRFKVCYVFITISQAVVKAES
jgi:ubiquitin carboxyl-terminal hydrolase 14